MGGSNRRDMGYLWRMAIAGDKRASEDGIILLGTRRGKTYAGCIFTLRGRCSYNSLPIEENSTTGMNILFPNGISRGVDVHSKNILSRGGEVRRRMGCCNALDMGYAGW